MPSRSTNKKSESETVVINYGFNGGRVNDEPETFARCRRDNGHARYFVSFLTDGPEAGRMRNTLSAHQDDARNNRPIGRTGKYLYELREVNEDAFESYMDFLNGGDEIALKNAERLAR